MTAAVHLGFEADAGFQADVQCADTFGPVHLYDRTWTAGRFWRLRHRQALCHRLKAASTWKMILRSRQISPIAECLGTTPISRCSPTSTEIRMVSSRMAALSSSNQSNRFPVRRDRLLQNLGVRVRAWCRARLCVRFDGVMRCLPFGLVEVRRAFDGEVVDSVAPLVRDDFFGIGVNQGGNVGAGFSTASASQPNVWLLDAGCRRCRSNRESFFGPRVCQQEWVAA